MSQHVVTPPAAADRDAVSMPGHPVEDEVCMCPSTSPGNIRLPPCEIVSVAGGGVPCPIAAMVSPRTATYPSRRMASVVTTVPVITRSNGVDTYIYASFGAITVWRPCREQCATVGTPHA